MSDSRSGLPQSTQNALKNGFVETERFLTKEGEASIPKHMVEFIRADEREQAAQRIDGHSQRGYRCECGADLNNYEHHLQNVIRGEA